jgi:hypothetical protein
VPTNTGSAQKTVLVPGPWKRTVHRTTIAARYSLVACAVLGDTDFRAIGKPSDAAMSAAVRRHEDLHARDHRRAFNATVRRWDRRLTSANKSGRVFYGADNAAAEAALHAAMGGTPDAIADAYWDEIARRALAFHGTPQGCCLEFTNPQVAPDCATSSIDGRMP